MRLRRHMRGRGRGKKKLILLCKDIDPLAFAIKIRKTPKIAVGFKVVLSNPAEIKKVFYQRPVVAMQTA